MGMIYSPGVAGLTGQVQFNNSGVIGADNSLFWDNINKRLGINNSSPSAQIDITNSSVSQTPLTIRGIASQTSDFRQCINSSNAVIERLTSTGTLILNNSATFPTYANAELLRLEVSSSGGTNGYMNFLRQSGASSASMSFGIASSEFGFRSSKHSNHGFTLSGETSNNFIVELGRANGTITGRFNIYGNPAVINLGHQSTGTTTESTLLFSGINNLGVQYEYSKIACFKQVDFTGDSVTAGLRFSTKNNSNSYITAMQISPSGIIGINTTTPSAQLSVVNSSASQVAVNVTAAASQSSNIQEWRNSSNIVRASVTKDFELQTTTGSGAPTTTPADGATYVDTTNHRFYVRSGGTWKYTNLI